MRLLLLPFALSLMACPPPAGSDAAADDDTADLAYADAGIPERPAPPEEQEVTICVPIAPLPDQALPRCTAATRTCAAFSAS